MMRDNSLLASSDLLTTEIFSMFDSFASNLVHLDQLKSIKIIFSSLSSSTISFRT